MGKLGKIVKDTVKAKKESVMGKLGDAPFEDPMEPWSAKYNAPVRNEEALTEDSVLYRYIRSKGYSPEHMDFAHRSAFARSNAFKSYKVMHQNKKKKLAGGIHDIKAVAKEEVEDLSELSKTTLSSYVKKAAHDHTDLSMSSLRHRQAGDETADKKVKKSEPDRADKMLAIAKKAGEHRNIAYKRDVKANKRMTGIGKAVDRLTKEDIQLDEAGVGKLMNFIKSKGLDPTSMDGNHKKHYSRSSEYRVFKTVHPDPDEARAKHKERSEKKKKVNETSGMGERGDDWNEDTQPVVKVKAKHTHEVFHNKTGQVTGKYTSLSRAHRAADKKDNEYGGYAHSVRPVKEEVDEADTVTMDIPLLIRVLEFAREDAKTDMDLHKVVENLINMRGEGTMSMDMYEKIVSIKEAIEEADEAKYGPKYQASVLAVKAKAEKKPVDMKSLAARMQASYAKDKKPLKELKNRADNMDYDDHITREEVEELSELSKGTLKSYIKGRGETIHADKADSNVARNRAADLEYRGKQAQADTNHDEADRLHQRARKGATNLTKAAIKVAKKTNEDIEEACSCDTPTRKQQSMKSARMIKSLYKKKLKESTYDWEKDDKGGKRTTATAKITLKGGTTMTGKPRDTVEIEPVLKTRPNRARGNNTPDTE